MDTLFYRFGKAIVKWRWIVVLLWIGLIIGFGSFAPKLSSVLTQGGFSVDNSSSQLAADKLQKEFPKLSTNQLSVVHKSSNIKISDEKFKNHVQKTENKLKADKRIKKVVTYLTVGNRLVGKDKDTALTVIYLKKKKAEDSLHDAPKIAAITHSVKTKGIKTYITGEALIWNDFSDLSEKDLAKAEMIGLPIAAVALLIAFGSIVASGIPLLLALSGLAIAFGLLYFIAESMPLNLYVQNISAMVGLGIGIDYSLLMVSRFKEELANSDVATAIAKTMNTSGRAVLFSGIAVIIAISGLWLVSLKVFRDFAAGVSIVAVVIVLAALTLLPAILTILGKRINWLGFGSKTKASKEGGLWQKWAYLIMNKPLIFFMIAAILLVAITSPVLKIKMGSHGAEGMPETFASKKGLDLLKEEFGEGELAAINVVVESKKDVLDLSTLKKLRNLEKALLKEDNVKKIDGIVNATDVLSSQVALLPQITSVPKEPLALVPQMVKDSKDAQAVVENVISDKGEGKTALIKIIPETDFTSDDTKKLVERIKNSYISKFNDDGFKIYVGGGTAEDLDFTNDVIKNFPKIFGLVLFLTFIVLLFVFRSLVLPIKAVIVNAISVFAAYGLLVLIFQYGYGDNLLGFKSLGIIGNFTPLFLFCIIFGLSMDYEVFLLSRVKEAYDQSGDNAYSVAFGLEKTGRIITSAAFIMISVFGAFALTRLLPIKESSLGMALAIFLDATLVRVVLVPAAMQLMGKWNWWLPKPLEKILPKVKVD